MYFLRLFLYTSELILCEVAKRSDILPDSLPNDKTSTTPSESAIETAALANNSALDNENGKGQRRTRFTPDVTAHFARVDLSKSATSPL